MTHPLRFCMVTTFYPPYSFGGDGIYVRALANELAQRGHQVDVIYCRDAYRFLARREPTTRLHDHPNVTLHPMESAFGWLSPLATQQTGRPLFKRGAIERVLSKGFDVIHYHNISLIGGPQILTMGSGIKLYTMHEFWLVCPMHILFRYNREVCTEPDCLRCTMAYRRPPQWWRYTNLLDDALPHVDCFLTLSRASGDRHREWGLDVPMVHLPPFVPPAPTPAPHEEPSALYDGADDKPYFLFVGRLEKLKGLQTVIPLFRDFEGARLLVAGQGEYEPELRDLAAGSDNIRFLGFQPAARLVPLYQKARALIVPSLCYEMSPLVILEAFQQGTPVLARNLGGMGETVRDSGGGALFEDEDSLRCLVERLMHNPGLRDEWGARALAWLEREATPAIHIERYLGLIERLASQRAVTAG